jgi:hypothetical protein
MMDTSLVYAKRVHEMEDKVNIIFIFFFIDDLG